MGGTAWKSLTNRLKAPTYISRGDHSHKIKEREQRTDVGKFSLINRTIRDWNNFPASVFERFPSSVKVFKSRVIRLSSEE